MAAHLQVVLTEGESFPRGHKQLRPDQIHTGDLLGDGMFHLQAGVHLEEIKVFARKQKLDRARVDVPNGLCGRDGGAGHPLTNGRGDRRTRGFFDHLLVPPLQCAITFKQVHGLPVRVGHDLHFDVPRPLNQAFDVDRAVGKRTGRFARRGRNGLVRFTLGAHNAHTLAATTGRRFQQGRVTDAAHGGPHHVELLRRRCLPGHHGHPGSRYGLARRRLGSHRRNHPRRRPDKCQAGGLTAGGKRGVFGEEAVARVHRIGTGPSRRREQRIDLEITLRGGRRSEQDCVIGRHHMGRAGIRFGVHRDRLNGHLATRTNDAHRNLAAVGNQHFLNHDRLIPAMTPVVFP